MDPEIDITQDLTDGSDGSLADTVSANNGNVPQGGNDASVKLPDGVVHANEAPKANTKELGLRDQLSNAFKGPDATDPEAANTPAKDVPQLTQDADGKWRTADGTFASKEQVDAFTAAQNTPTPDTNAQEQAPAYTSRMTPLEQQQFQALPAELREFFGRTMEAVEGQASRFNEYGIIEQSLIGPRREAWATNGMTPAVALNQLFALSDFATRTPKDFVLWFADQHQIDLDAALDERDQLQHADPQVRAMQAQLQQLQSQLGQSNQGQVQAQQDAYLREVQTFGEEKDEAGKLKRPYLTDVGEAWPLHIQSVRAANPSMPNAEVLQKAYEAACWANPAVRTKMQDAARQQHLADAQRRANEARLAGSSVNGAPGGVQTNAAMQQDANRSIRDELKAAFAEHVG